VCRFRNLIALQWELERRVELRAGNTRSVVATRSISCAKLFTGGWKASGFLNEWYAVGYLGVDFTPNSRPPIENSLLKKLSESGEISVELDE
jgi:hypothetical protein